MPVIQFFSEDTLLFTHRIQNERILIGRGYDCDISLPFIDVSRIHCMIVPRSGELFLVNRSQHGTLVNDQLVQRSQVKPGDTITIGSCKLRIESHVAQRQTLQVTAKQANPLHNRPNSSPPPARKQRQRIPGSKVCIIGESAPIHQLLTSIERIAQSDAPTLLVGESGTGKELAAHSVHQQSSRSASAFIAVNCAAINANLFESELFGHEKGSFSGAIRQTDGAFRAADGGTLFLDEVGELPLELQAKLLRALETGEIRRVGATSTSKPNVRIIAATNRDLGQMIREGSFREDLAYRLSILTVRLPPLRERKADIPALARHLLEQGQHDAWLTDACIQALKNHDWPGNVRELRNVLTRAAVIYGGELSPEHIELGDWGFGAPPSRLSRKNLSRDAIVTALSRHNGNRTHAARELVIPRSTLLYKMKLMAIEA